MKSSSAPRRNAWSMPNHVAPVHHCSPMSPMNVMPSSRCELLGASVARSAVDDDDLDARIGLSLQTFDARARDSEPFEHGHRHEHLRLSRSPLVSTLPVLSLVVTGGGWQYLAVFLVSAAFSLLLTPLVLRFALRRNVLDLPGGHKSHTDPVPYLGGLAIVAAFALTVVVAALVRPPVSGRGELFVVLGLAVLLAFVGLLDDLTGLSPVVRLVVEAGAGLAVWAVGGGIDLFGPGVTDAAITVLWVVGITNAFNLLDNMDGLSSGVAAIAAGSIFVIASKNGQFLVAGLAIGLAGCAIGFLRHNFHPARIYMGDAGALFLGFMLAYLGMKLRFDAPTSTTFLVPILIMGVPIFDTTLVTVTRLRRGVSPFLGGRDHTSHRIVRAGLPVPAAVVLIYTIGICLGMVAFVVSRIDRTLRVRAHGRRRDPCRAVRSAALAGARRRRRRRADRLRARPYAHPMAKSRRTSHRPARPSSTTKSPASTPAAPSQGTIVIDPQPAASTKATAAAKPRPQQAPAKAAPEPRVRLPLIIGAGLSVLWLLLWVIGVLSTFGLALFMIGLSWAAIAVVDASGHLWDATDPLRSARRIGVLWVVVALPVAFDPGTAERFGLAKLTVLMVGALALAMLWIVDAITNTKLPDLRTGLHWPILAMVVVGTLATILSVSPRLSLVGAYQSYDGLLALLSFAVVALVAAESWRASDLRRILTTFVLAAGGLVVLYGLIQTADLELGTHWDWIHFVNAGASFGPTSTVWSTFGNPNHLAGFIACLLPIGVIVVISDRSLIVRAITGAVLLGGLVCLVETSSLGGLGASVGALVLTGVLLDPGAEGPAPSGPLVRRRRGGRRRARLRHRRSAGHDLAQARRHHEVVVGHQHRGAARAVLALGGRHGEGPPVARLGARHVRLPRAEVPDAEVRRRVRSRPGHQRRAQHVPPDAGDEGRARARGTPLLPRVARVAVGRRVAQRTRARTIGRGMARAPADADRRARRDRRRAAAELVQRRAARREHRLVGDGGCRERRRARRWRARVPQPCAHRAGDAVRRERPRRTRASATQGRTALGRRRCRWRSAWSSWSRSRGSRARGGAPIARSRLRSTARCSSRRARSSRRPRSNAS